MTKTLIEYMYSGCNLEANIKKSTVSLKPLDSSIKLHLTRDQKYWTTHLQKLIFCHDEKDCEKWLDKKFNYSKPEKNGSKLIITETNALQALLLHLGNKSGTELYYPGETTFKMVTAPKNSIYQQIETLVKTEFDLNELAGSTSLDYPCPMRQYNNHQIKCRYLKQKKTMFSSIQQNIIFSYCYDEKITVKVSILSYLLLKQRFKDFLRLCYMKHPNETNLEDLVKKAYRPLKGEILLMCLLRNVPFFIVDQLGDIVASKFEKKDSKILRLGLACQVSYFCKF